MVGVFVGRSAYYLSRAREEATNGVNVKEALGIVLKRLKSSILYALIPAVLFYYLYDIQRPDSGLTVDDNLFLGGIVLFFIIGGLAIFNGEIRWLLHLFTSRWAVRKPEKAPPLQQQMRKRP